MKLWNMLIKPFQITANKARARERESYLLGDSSIVTPDNAQQISTVLACVNIKANALAVIPAKLYKYTGKGKEEHTQSPLYNILRYQPNPNLVASLYKKMISQDLDLRGNHYSQIVRDGLGNVVALYPLIADKMEVLSHNNKKIYKYGGQVVNAKQILHIFDIPDETGHKGLSRIEYAKHSLEFAKNASKHGNNLFKNGATPSGVFTKSGVLSEEAYERLRDQLERKYQGVDNAGKTMLLEDDLEFKPLDIKNSDAEWLASRKYNREEICAIFGVPSSMVNDTANTAYGNLEQKYLEFYTGTVFPLTTIIEEIFRMSLLSDEQKKYSVIKFKYNTMLRVDAKTRAEYYQTRFNTGSITPNEIREYEDENGFEGGDECYLQLNLSTVNNLNKGNNNG